MKFKTRKSWQKPSKSPIEKTSSTRVKLWVVSKYNLFQNYFQILPYMVNCIENWRIAFHESLYTVNLHLASAVPIYLRNFRRVDRSIFCFKTPILDLKFFNNFAFVDLLLLCFNSSSFIFKTLNCSSISDSAEGICFKPFFGRGKIKKSFSFEWKWKNTFILIEFWLCSWILRVLIPQKMYLKIYFCCWEGTKLAFVTWRTSDTRWWRSWCLMLLFENSSTCPPIKTR